MARQFWQDKDARARFIASTKSGAPLQDAALAAGWDPEETERVAVQGTADRVSKRRTKEAAFVTEIEAAEGVARAAFVDSAYKAATVGTEVHFVTIFKDGTQTKRAQRRGPDGRLAFEILKEAHRQRATRAMLAAQLTTEGGGVVRALAAAHVAAAHGNSDLMRLAQRLVQAEALAKDTVEQDPTQRPPVRVEVVQASPAGTGTADTTKH